MRKSKLVNVNKVLLITGVAGFLGRYIARHFSRNNWQVIGIDNSPPENAPTSSLSYYRSLRLPSVHEFNNLLQEYKPDACVHCAGRASVGLSMLDPLADFQSNTILTFDILNSLRLHAPNCRFIFFSSAAVYGDPGSLPVEETQRCAPISPYGFHKWQSELLCREFFEVYGLPTANLRIFSAYGPGLRRQVVWDICQKALTQKQLILQGIGNESRDFIHALDIAIATETILTSAPMQGESYNLASGQEVTIAHLADLVLQALRLERPITFEGNLSSGTPTRWQASIAKLQKLSFAPSISLEQGIITFSNWCRAELE